MVRRFLLNIAVSALALWVADWALAGFAVSDGIWGYIIAGAVLALLNTFVRPILMLLTFPVMALTLGLFSVVINIAILVLANHLLDSVSITGLSTLLLATLIVSLVQTLLGRHE